MLENTVQVAQSTYDSEVERVGARNGDDERRPRQAICAPIADRRPAVRRSLRPHQTYQRSLSTKRPSSPSGRTARSRSLRAGQSLRPADRPVTVAQALAKLKRETAGRAEVAINSPDRIAALTRLDYGPEHLSLRRAQCSSRRFPASRSTAPTRCSSDYRALLERSRGPTSCGSTRALLLGALIIVGLAIFTALEARRPAGAARSASWSTPPAGSRKATSRPGCRSANTEDEIQTLATAFNRMTGRLEEQTGALMAANAQLETRRAFIEAVLSSVTAGVIALDSSNRILLINRSAETLLPHGAGRSSRARRSAEVSPELDEFMRGDQPRSRRPGQRRRAASARWRSSACATRTARC